MWSTGRASAGSSSSARWKCCRARTPALAASTAAAASSTARVPPRVVAAALVAERRAAEARARVERAEAALGVARGVLLAGALEPRRRLLVERDGVGDAVGVVVARGVALGDEEERAPALRLRLPPQRRVGVGAAEELVRLGEGGARAGELLDLPAHRLAVARDAVLEAEPRAQREAEGDADVRRARQVLRRAEELDALLVVAARLGEARARHVHRAELDVRRAQPLARRAHRRRGHALEGGERVLDRQLEVALGVEREAPHRRQAHRRRRRRRLGRGRRGPLRRAAGGGGVVGERGGERGGGGRRAGEGGRRRGGARRRERQRRRVQPAAEADDGLAAPSPGASVTQRGTSSSASRSEASRSSEWSAGRRAASPASASRATARHASASRRSITPTSPSPRASPPITELRVAAACACAARWRTATARPARRARR